MEYFEVESIEDKRYSPKIQYLVKWVGYPSS